MWADGHLYFKADPDGLPTMHAYDRTLITAPASSLSGGFIKLQALRLRTLGINRLKIKS